MGRSLAGFVYVTDPATGAAARFGPEDTVPGWARDQITNPKAWSGDEDAAAGDATTTHSEFGDNFAPRHEAAEATAGDGDSARDYASMTVLELRAAIKTRNEGRNDDTKVPGDGNKAELIAALEADDQRP